MDIERLSWDLIDILRKSNSCIRTEEGQSFTLWHSLSKQFGLIFLGWILMSFGFCLINVQITRAGPSQSMAHPSLWRTWKLLKWRIVVKSIYYRVLPWIQVWWKVFGKCYHLYMFYHPIELFSGCFVCRSILYSSLACQNHLWVRNLISFVVNVFNKCCWLGRGIYYIKFYPGCNKSRTLRGQ